MFGTGYPGKGAAEGENHGEGWEIGEAEMWTLQRNKTDGREGPHPSILAPNWLCAVLWTLGGSELLSSERGRQLAGARPVIYRNNLVTVYT